MGQSGRQLESKGAKVAPAAFLACPSLALAPQTALTKPWKHCPLPSEPTEGGFLKP